MNRVSGMNYQYCELIIENTDYQHSVFLERKIFDAKLLSFHYKYFRLSVCHYSHVFFRQQFFFSF